jgi:hypothetical protein
MRWHLHVQNHPAKISLKNNISRVTFPLQYVFFSLPQAKAQLPSPALSTARSHLQLKRSQSSREVWRGRLSPRPLNHGADDDDVTVSAVDVTLLGSNAAGDDLCDGGCCHNTANGRGEVAGRCGLLLAEHRHNNGGAGGTGCCCCEGNNLSPPRLKRVGTMSQIFSQANETPDML